jgi:O-antigen/teichoic acid export membrane protein
MVVSVKKNYIYSVLYQILAIVVPLITTPYLSRILGAENIGIYSYTNSIVQYFQLISMLGILDYGNRTIASCRNREELGRDFLEIYLIQFTSGMIAIIMYIIYIFAGEMPYRSIAIIQLISLVSALLDINWFFFGIEKFKLTVTRNTIIKLVTLVSIFAFVHDSNDLWKYVLIMVGGVFISNAVLWIYIHNEIDFVKVRYCDCLKHLKPCLILLFPLISRSIFVYMDKTMLGLMAGMTETGYYEYSEQIVLGATCIITPLGTVMLPRISNLIAEGREDVAMEYTALSIDFVVAVGAAFTMGLLAISNLLAVVFLGTNYYDCGRIISVMSWTVLLVGWTNVIRTQYILPYKKDTVYMVAVFAGAVVDFIVNLLLIPQYGAYGAAIGWVGAEIVITLTQTYYAGKRLPIGMYLKNCIGYIISATIMSIIVAVVVQRLKTNVMSLIICVVLGALVYSVLTLIYLKVWRKNLWRMFSMQLSRILTK